MARRRPSAPRGFQRTDRVGELVREIVASELERIGDERLELVTITACDVDASLERGVVGFSALGAEEEGQLDEVVEALDVLRWRAGKAERDAELGLTRAKREVEEKRAKGEHVDRHSVSAEVVVGGRQT